MRLLLDCSEDPVDPGFEIDRSTFQKMLIGINPNLLTMPENMPSDTHSDTTRMKEVVTSHISVPETPGHATILVVEGLWMG